jgi:hypothetical protein
MRISGGVRTVVSQDGAVLMDINGGFMFSLNPIGSLIWQQLSDGRSPAQVAEDLTHRFGVSLDQARVDVNGFIGQLEAQHLVCEWESENSRNALGAKQPKGVLDSLLGRTKFRK